MRFAFAASMVSAALVANVAAAGDNDWSDCSSTVRERVVSGCSVVLSRGESESAKRRAVALTNRATAYYEAGRLDAALEDGAAAIRLDPTYSEAFYAHGSALLGSGRADDAIVDFNRALKLNPKSASTHNARGKANLEKGDLDKAIADFNEALRQNPKMAFALTGRGSAYREKGDLDKAYADYSDAIKLDRGYASPYIGRGNILLDKHMWNEAVADYSKAIELEPKSALGHNNRGVAYRLLGQLDRAVDDQNTAVALDVKNARLVFNRGLTLHTKGDLPAAAADYTEAIKLNVNYALAYQARGIVLQSQGDSAGALSDLDRAVKLNEKLPLAFLTRGKIRLGQSDWQHALIDFADAIRLEPKQAPAYFGRGFASEALGDNAKAKADFDAAIGLSPGYAEAFFHRGKVLEKQAKFALAAEDFREAAKLNPNFLDARDALKTVMARIESIKPDVIAPPTAIVKLNRVALVIGNSHYTAVAPLGNPGRDAEAVAEALRTIGFRAVQVEHDLNLEGMKIALQKFEEKADLADWAIIYYAGHGVEVGGVNYLIPVNARLEDERKVKDEAVPVSRLLDAVERTKQLRMLILDACRDNPFLLSMKLADGSRSIHRGLAREEPKEGGTLIAFSAKQGQVALDGSGEHSPFVIALLHRLATPGIEIRKLFGLVRDDVLAATERRQEPYVYGTLGGDDYVWHPAN
jgi:tetratricopeptide (TPR) repeat protein